MDTTSFSGALVSNTDPAGLPGPEPLIGQYVKLERLNKSHFPDLYDHLCSHPEVWTWWPNEPPGTPAEFNSYLTDLLTSYGEGVSVYAIMFPSGPQKEQAHGLAIALSEDRLTHRVAEMGLLFGPRLQRTTAATEVVYLVARLLFELNNRRLAWKTNALNLPSKKAAARYGFVYEGTFRQHQINKGRNRDSAWYSIIDSEWPVCKKAFEMWLEEANFDDQNRQRRRLEEIRESLKKV